MIHRRQSLSLSILLLQVPIANAAGAVPLSIGAAGLANLTMVNASSGTTKSRSNALVGFGGGLLASGSLLPNVSIDAGAFYERKRFGSDDALVTLNFLSVPVSLRITLVDLLTFSAGGYYAMAFGKGELEIDKKKSQYSFTDLGYKSSDHGVFGGVGLARKVGSGAQIFVEGRYCLGLAEASSSATVKRSFVTIEALAGLRIPLAR